MMFAKNDILVEGGVRIESLVDHECTTSTKDLRLYQCMEHSNEYTFNKSALDYDYVVDYFNQQYGYKRNSRKW